MKLKPRVMIRGFFMPLKILRKNTTIIWVKSDNSLYFHNFTFARSKF